MYQFIVKSGMLAHALKRYNQASANILRKQLDNAGIYYKEEIVLQ